MSAEKAENRQIFVVWCNPELRCFPPTARLHSLPQNSLWKWQPSSSNPGAARDFPFILSSSSSRLARNWFITRPKEFDRECDIETCLLPDNCFYDSGIGRGKERWVIQWSSTPSRHLRKNRVAPTVWDLNFMKKRCLWKMYCLFFPKSITGTVSTEILHKPWDHLLTLYKAAWIWLSISSDNGSQKEQQF